MLSVGGNSGHPLIRETCGSAGRTPPPRSARVLDSVIPTDHRHGVQVGQGVEPGDGEAVESARRVGSPQHRQIQGGLPAPAPGDGAHLVRPQRAWREAAVGRPRPDQRGIGLHRPDDRVHPARVHPQARSDRLGSRGSGCDVGIVPQVGSSIAPWAPQASRLLPRASGLLAFSVTVNGTLSSTALGRSPSSPPVRSALRARAGPTPDRVDPIRRILRLQLPVLHPVALRDDHAVGVDPHLQGGPLHPQQARLGGQHIEVDHHAPTDGGQPDPPSEGRRREHPEHPASPIDAHGVPGVGAAVVPRGHLMGSPPGATPAFPFPSSPHCAPTRLVIIGWGLRGER